MAISFASLATAKYQRTVIITSTQSWTCPTGVTTADVFLVGGGGGGGYYTNGIMAGGGGGGGVIQQSVNVTPGNSYTITIGAGGGENSKGGNSSFGSLITSYGGAQGGTSGAAGITNVAVGSGGGASGDGNRGGAGGGSFPWSVNPNGYNQNQTLNYTIKQGSIGYAASYVFNGNPGINGYGAGGGYGTNQLASEGKGGLNAGNGANVSAGLAATSGDANFGGGGGGGSSSSPGGASGGSGVCIIKYWA